MSAKTMQLSINKCPVHGDMSISIDDENGGLRLTPNKCCGRWVSIAYWHMTAQEFRGIAKELECFAHQSETAE